MLEEWSPDEDCLGTTNFDVAKYIVTDLLAKKTHGRNILSVIVLKTPLTHHHFNRDGGNTTTKSKTSTTSATGEPANEEITIFPNITEWTKEEDGNLLERVQNLAIEPLSRRNNKKRKLTSDSNSIGTTSSTSLLEGDFLMGIIVAADTMFRTSSDKVSTSSINNSTCQQQQQDVSQIERRIVLLTDAKHEIHVTNEKQILVVMDCLRSMNCQLNVIGIGFEKGANFDKSNVKSNNSTSSDDDDSEDEEDDNDGEEDDGEEDEEDDIDDIKRQNEAMLINLTGLLGGYVLPSKSLEEILRRVHQEELSQEVDSQEAGPQKFLNLRLGSRKGRKIIQIAANCSSETLYRRSEEVFGVTVDAIWYGYPLQLLEPSANIPISSVLNDNEKIHVELDAGTTETCNEVAKVVPDRTSIRSRGPYNDHSLRPDLVAWVTWNGTDDVSLDEWLERVRPSNFNDILSDPVGEAPVCSWISIENVRQDSPGYERKMSAIKSTDPYMAPLNEISNIIARGRRVPNAAKQWCIDEIMRIAKENNYVVGKWLVYASRDTADEIWETIARATAMGKLGCGSKIMPTKNLADGNRTVMCVYVKDSTDKHEVQRVLRYLHDDMGITSGLSGFKPDVFTRLKIYSKNEWRLKPTLYNWKDALEWDLSDSKKTL
jgi:hypothetical protein